LQFSQDYIYWHSYFVLSVVSGIPLSYGIW